MAVAAGPGPAAARLGAGPRDGRGGGGSFCSCHAPSSSPGSRSSIASARLRSGEAGQESNDRRGGAVPQRVEVVATLQGQGDAPQPAGSCQAPDPPGHAPVASPGPPPLGQRAPPP